MSAVNLSGNEKGRLSQGDPLAVLPVPSRKDELDASIPDEGDPVTWLRLDDGFTEHEKIDGLSNAAFRLHVSGLCYCARMLTDGRIPRSRVSRLMPNFEGNATVELVKARLWNRTGDGWEINDYLDYNPSAAEVRANREAERVRKAHQRARGTVQVGQSEDGRFVSRRDDQQDTRLDSAGESPATRPVPSPSKVKVKTNGDASAADTDFEAQFWPLWPDKRNKGAARKAWPKAVKAAGGVEPILEGVTRFAADPNLPPRGSHFMPHAATWLNGERWLDWPLPSMNGHVTPTAAQQRTERNEQALGAFIRDDQQKAL